MNTNFRNEMLNGKVFELNPGFRLPTIGCLEFDYCSTRRPPRSCQGITDARLGQLMRLLIVSNCVIGDLKLLLQSSVAPFIWVSCIQLRRILQLFMGNLNIAFDILVCFACRCGDWHLNEKVLRCAFWRNDWHRNVRHRLSMSFTFPFLQPEGYLFELDCRYAEDRQMLGLLLGYQSRETGMQFVDVLWDEDR